MLHRMALDQRGRLCWDDASEREMGGCKERAEIRFGAFATADHQHYFEAAIRGCAGAETEFELQPTLPFASGGLRAPTFTGRSVRPGKCQIAGDFAPEFTGVQCS